MGRLIVTNLLAFAEFERAMIIERIQGGKAIAKLESYSYKQVEELTGISKSTLIREKRKRTVA